MKQAQKSFDSKSSEELADDLVEMALEALKYCHNLENSIIEWTILLSGFGIIIYNLLILSYKGQEGTINWGVILLGCFFGLAHTVYNGNAHFYEFFYSFHLTCICGSLYSLKSVQKTLNGAIKE
jgi:hypothetical protein